MATTPVDFKAPALATPSDREFTLPRVESWGKTETKPKVNRQDELQVKENQQQKSNSETSGDCRRHYELLSYLNRAVRRCCPNYLREHQDDVVQTVLIRLDDKLEALEKSFVECYDLLTRNPGHDSKIADILLHCLEEIGKSVNRETSKDLEPGWRRCRTWAEAERGRSVDRAEREDLAAILTDSLTWLRTKSSKDIFAKRYIERGVHWAILDVKNKVRCLAEVSPEEREDGSWENEVPAPGTSPGRSIIIRQEISDCLSRLDEAKRRPTLLALMGYEYSEIAEFLGLSVPQTDSRVRRGKAFLRDCLTSKGVSL